MIKTYAAWYWLRGKLTRAVGRRGSVTLTTDTLHLAEAAAARRGHSISVIRELVPIADQVLHVARSQVGFCEEPRNSNWGMPVETYLRFAGWQRPAPWCCAFALWVVAQVDPTLIPLRTASVFELTRWAQTHGYWSDIGRAADLAVFPAFEHIGIVEDPATRTIIAGNTSASDGSNYNGGMVGRHTYPPGAFQGFVRLPDRSTAK